MKTSRTASAWFVALATIEPITASFEICSAASVPNAARRFSRNFQAKPIQISPAAWTSVCEP